MNSPIFNDTVKVFDTLKNSKGSYSPKNKTLVELGENALKLGIGCNFVVNTEFNDDTYYNAKDGNFSMHKLRDILKVSEIVNYFTCLSVTLSDRAIVVTHNKNNNLIVVVIAKSKFPTTLLVRDKDSVEFKTVTVKNAFDSNAKPTELKQVTKKGVRPISESEINQLKTAFNGMYGHNYNKPLVEKVENTKNEKSA